MFQSELASFGKGRQSNINSGIRSMGRRHNLPGISNLVRVQYAATALNPLLEPIRAIEINPESLLRYRMKDEPQILSNRTLKPRFDIFRNTECIKHSFPTGTDIKRKIHAPLVLAIDYRHHGRISWNPQLRVVHFGHLAQSKSKQSVLRRKWFYRRCDRNR